MKIYRTTVAACATAVSAALIAGAVAPASNAATAIGVNGIGGGEIGNSLQGWVWEGSTARANLDYSDNPLAIDSSIRSGVRALQALMARTPDVDRLIGISQSALVIVAALREHPDLVPAGGLTVYLIGNPARERTGISDRFEGGYVPIVGLSHQGPIPQGIPGLTVIDVSFEYDGLSDSPNPFNLIAVFNAFVGATVLHPFYGDVDMNDPDLLVRTIGTTTQYLVPVSRLPMLSPLYGLGLGAIARVFEPLLRAIIDPAHDRAGYVRLGSLPQAQGMAASAVPESAQASLRGEFDYDSPDSPDTFSLDVPSAEFVQTAGGHQEPVIQKFEDTAPPTPVVPEGSGITDDQKKTVAEVATLPQPSGPKKPEPVKVDVTPLDNETDDDETGEVEKPRDVEQSVERDDRPTNDSDDNNGDDNNTDSPGD